jgi:hypothetical protein
MIILLVEKQGISGIYLKPILRNMLLRFLNQNLGARARL